MSDALDRLAAYWYSLRYQHTDQILARIQYWLAWKLYPRFPSLVRMCCEQAKRPSPSFCWEPLAHARGSVLVTRSTEPRPSGSGFPGYPIDWNPPDRSLLRKFHLHYFDWAPRCEPDLLARQIASWIESNPPGSWPGWHPYPTSLRIRNWIRALGPDVTPEVASSLATQTAFLERNLEFHLGGNHLLENAFALLVAGLYFESRRWRNLGLELLCRELATQVLPDGGHIERSPYYHRRMTELVSEAVRLLADPPAELSRAAEAMTRFQRALRHLDGSPPLFHDALDCHPDPNPIPPEPRSFPDSGYYILDNPYGRLIADYGAPADNSNPGHQHAGIFSFEVSTPAGKLIVDSGTETYEPGPTRDRLRSTAAHNTVRVDGCDQFQVWGTFRVGRRARITSVKETREGDFQAISAEHDGYQRLGVMHRRTIVCLAHGGWLIIDDLSGHGAHRIESFVHLAPGVTPVIEDGRISLMPFQWVLIPFGLAGTVQPLPALRFVGQPSLPSRFGYFLSPPPVR